MPLYAPLESIIPAIFSSMCIMGPGVANTPDFMGPKWYLSWMRSPYDPYQRLHDLYQGPPKMTTFRPPFGHPFGGPEEGTKDLPVVMDMIQGSRPTPLWAITY